ncbi:hypothetical protein PG994_002975 [Apiospora phragmitis]|uniref:Uncharacterized protein n=1 Tax=Apiospora phragmitis TaxID=2905665 RepID=A0ABR1W6Q1_9PEZI
MESTFYVTRRFPCGHSAVYEHPAIILRKMTRAGLVPRDQEFAQITVHLGTSDGCITCPPPVKTTAATATTTINVTEEVAIHHDEYDPRQQAMKTTTTTSTTKTKSLLKHSFCCEHNMRRPMHDGLGEAIVLEVESAYCEGCQEAKMREVYESLHALEQELGLGLDLNPSNNKTTIIDDDHSSSSSSSDDDDDDEPQRQRLRRSGEDELRDMFRQLEEAQLTAELAPWHFRGSLRVFADICVAAIGSPPERLRAWVQTLTPNEYLVADVQKAIEERLVKKSS